jgi:hypothetical protein
MHEIMVIKSWLKSVSERLWAAPIRATTLNFWSSGIFSDAPKITGKTLLNAIFCLADRFLCMAFG